MAARDGGFTWMAFLAVAFVVVGLTGLFASVAAPLPLDRALSREAALDDAQAALQTSDPASALEALRPRLADSADRLLPLGGDMPARIAQERREMRARLAIEAREIGIRLRWLICVVTLMGAGFGVAVLRLSTRR